MRRFFLAAALLFVIFQPPAAGQVSPVPHPASDTLAESVRRIVADVARDQRVVGYAVSVRYRDSLIVSDAAGWADLEHRVPVTPATRFQVASITKTFTGLAVLQLAEAGRLDLDAPIQTYVPSFPEKPGPPITARLLASHRGGIRRYRPDERTWDLFSRHFDTATEALEVFKDDSLVAPPGTRSWYSSYGFTLLAAAVEGVTGRPFPAYLDEAVFRPLHLDRTLVPDARVPIADRARSYYYADWDADAADSILFRAPDYDFSYNYGGGNLLTTADDLARYGQAFSSSGHLLSRASLGLIYETPLDPGGSFGWLTQQDADGRRFIHATGAVEAFLAGITVWPDDDLVVVVLANSWGPGARSGALNYEVPLRIGALVLRE